MKNVSLCYRPAAATVLALPLVVLLLHIGCRGRCPAHDAPISSALSETLVDHPYCLTVSNLSILPDEAFLALPRLCHSGFLNAKAYAVVVGAGSRFKSSSSEKHVSGFGYYKPVL